MSTASGIGKLGAATEYAVWLGSARSTETDGGFAPRTTEAIRSHISDRPADREPPLDCEPRTSNRSLVGSEFAELASRLYDCRLRARSSFRPCACPASAKSLARRRNSCARALSRDRRDCGLIGTSQWNRSRRHTIALKSKPIDDGYPLIKLLSR